MFRFVRTLTVRESGDLPAAVQFAAETTAYSNKNYAVNFKYGTESGGEQKIYWSMDFDSYAKLREYADKIMKDREYWALLQKTKGVFVEGSMKDTFVNFVD